MRVWLIEIGEPLSVIDGSGRDWRCGILSKELISRGHEVTWWASTFEHQTKRYYFDGPRVVEAMPGLQIRLLHGPSYSANKSPMRVLNHLIVARAFSREAKNVPKPDIICCHLPTLELAEQAVLYGKRTGIPVVVEILDLWPDFYLTMVPPIMRAFLKKILFLEFRRARRVLCGATSIFAISQDFLDWGIRHAGRELTGSDAVFPLGYPTNPPSLAKFIDAKRAELVDQYTFGPDEFIVAFAGTFTPSFDLPTVIEAARIFEHGEGCRVRFVFIGDGDKDSSLRNQARGLSKIVFTGWFDQISISAILSLSSAGLVPYKEGLPISLPNKPFEYMAAGLPMISSLRGELETLICDEQIGLQYKAGNVDSLVKKIHWLVAHPKERQAMGRRARNLFEEQYCSEVIYPRMIQQLEKVASRGRFPFLVEGAEILR